MNTNNNYNKLTEEQQVAREKDVKRYLDAKKAMPEISNQLAAAIIDSNGYKERAPLIKGTHGEKTQHIEDAEKVSVRLKEERVIAERIVKEKRFMELLHKYRPLEYQNHIDMEYLQYASREFKKFWETATPEDKSVYRKHVEFTPDGTNIIGKSGKKYELAKECLTVEEPGKVDGYVIEKAGLFEWNTMMRYCKKHNITIPTREMYLDMLAVLPGGNVLGEEKGKMSFSHLLTVLGSSGLSDITDVAHTYGEIDPWATNYYDMNPSSALWTSSPGGEFSSEAYVLWANTDPAYDRDGYEDDSINVSLYSIDHMCSVRPLRSPK